MKKFNIKSVALVIFFILLCVGAILFAENKTGKRQTLQIIKPEIKTIMQKKVISGNLYPVKEIEVKSSVSGTLETYYVQIGDIVKAGEKIAKVKMLPEPSQVENARTNVKKNRIVFENDQINYERDAKLFEKGVISQMDFDAVSRAYLISKEQYESARNQLRLLEEGYIPETNISNVIMATTNGTIIDLPMEEGMPVAERNTFREGSTVALIAKLDSFLFKGKVVESDVVSLKKGMKIIVTPISQSNLEIEAKIRKIFSKGKLDQGVMKYDIEAIMVFPDSISIYSGFSAFAEIIIKEKEDALVVPEQYVQFSNDSAFVNIIDNGNLKKRKIDTGISDGLNIEILKGLSLEDEIVK